MLSGNTFEHAEKVGLFVQWLSKKEPELFAAREPQEPVVEKEKPEAPRCAFCDSVGSVWVSDPSLPSCETHYGLLKLYVERLAAGGMQDCPEEREAMHRVAAAYWAEADLIDAKMVGFRTTSDCASQRRLSLEELPPARRAPAEAVASAGMTPHFEWP